MAEIKRVGRMSVSSCQDLILSLWMISNIEKDSTSLHARNQKEIIGDFLGFSKLLLRLTTGHIATYYILILKGPC